MGEGLQHERDSWSPAPEASPPFPRLPRGAAPPPRGPPSPSFSLFEILGFQPQALIPQIQDIRNRGSERF